MTRWIAIDYGEKRIGVAITDPLKLFAKPHCTIENHTDAQVESEIIKIIKEQKVDKLIVGLPIAISGDDSAKTKEVRDFVEKLKISLAHTGCQIEMWDERYSTADANELCKQKGLDWKNARKVVDQIAAAVILQNYLNQTVATAT